MSERLQNLVIVRHGESEGDERRAAWRRGEKYITDKTPDEEGLTDRGIAESTADGEYIREHILAKYILGGFDMCYVSGVLRAEQSAVAMDIPDAIWQEDFRLSERNRGRIRGLTKKQHQEMYPDSYQQMVSSPLEWIPPDGQSILDLSDQLFDFLEDTRNHKDVLIVGHRDSMWALMKPLDGLDNIQLAAVDTEQIRNGQIWCYTSIDPESGREAEKLKWKRVIDPLLDMDSGWFDLNSADSNLSESLLGRY